MNTQPSSRPAPTQAHYALAHKVKFALVNLEDPDGAAYSIAASEHAATAGLRAQLDAANAKLAAAESREMDVRQILDTYVGVEERAEAAEQNVRRLLGIGEEALLEAETEVAAETLGGNVAKLAVARLKLTAIQSVVFPMQALAATAPAKEGA